MLKLRKSKEKPKRAFTLVEVLVGVATFGLIMTATAGILYNIQWSWQRQRDDMLCLGNNRWALEFMSAELRQAGNITAASDRINLDLDTNADNNPDTTVWYWCGNTSSDGNGLGNSAYLYRGIGNGIGQAYTVRYQLANFITNNPSGNNIFSESSGLITIELTTRKGTRGYTARTQVRTRN